MLEPFRQVGQWAWQQASSKATPLGGSFGVMPSSYTSSDQWIPQGQAGSLYQTPYLSTNAEASDNVVLPVPESLSAPVQESVSKLAPEAVQNKAMKPSAMQGVTFQAIWPEGAKQLNRLKQHISQPISQSAWAQALLKHSPQNSKPQSSKPVSKPQAAWKKLSEKLGLKKPPQKLPEHPSSGFRPREQVLKGFPYRDLNKVPHFSIKPEQIAWNPNAEALWRLESEVLNAPWDSQHLFNPFLDDFG